MEKKKQKARLENWYVGEDDLLHGEVYGHPLFGEGDSVRTSRLVKFDPESKKAITLNTEYELGAPRQKNLYGL